MLVKAWLTLIEDDDSASARKAPLALFESDSAGLALAQEHLLTLAGHLRAETGDAGDQGGKPWPGQSIADHLREVATRVSDGRWLAIIGPTSERGLRVASLSRVAFSLGEERHRATVELTETWREARAEGVRGTPAPELSWSLILAVGSGPSPLGIARRP